MTSGRADYIARNEDSRALRSSWSTLLDGSPKGSYLNVTVPSVLGSRNMLIWAGGSERPVHILILWAGSSNHTGKSFACTSGQMMIPGMICFIRKLHISNTQNSSPKCQCLWSESISTLKEVF